MSPTSIWRLIRKDLRMLAYEEATSDSVPGHNEQASYPWEENYSTTLQRQVTISSVDR
ncbi:Hypothetical protein FKW44_016517 [Caligus rogercresseyi]|uniref:Uncharacterized protein n=1 Tax=Caligus rogercresseyi TaxID=217165 RepID=A0A7T8H212_CALRO|nr:Hypothetical protein FKW44_016517 [Caligus rogercresseyi]